MLVIVILRLAQIRKYNHYDRRKKVVHICNTKTEGLTEEIDEVIIHLDSDTDRTLQ